MRTSTSVCLIWITVLYVILSISYAEQKEEPASTIETELEAIDRRDYWETHPEENPLYTAGDARNLATVVDAVCSVIETEYGTIPDDSCRTSIMQCVLNRVNAPGFPNTIQEVCTQKNQWQGYSESLQPSNETVLLARKLLSLQDECHEIGIPSNCVYFCLTSQGIEYRSTWDGTDIVLIKFCKNS